MLRHKLSRRSDMNQHLAVKHTYAAGAEFSVLRHEPVHHQLMSLQ